MSVLEWVGNQSLAKGRGTDLASRTEAAGGNSARGGKRTTVQTPILQVLFLGKIINKGSGEAEEGLLQFLPTCSVGMHPYPQSGWPARQSRCWPRSAEAY